MRSRVLSAPIGREASDAIDRTVQNQRARAAATRKARGSRSVVKRLRVGKGPNRLEIRAFRPDFPKRLLPHICLIPLRTEKTARAHLTRYRDRTNEIARAAT